MKSGLAGIGAGLLLTAWPGLHAGAHAADAVPVLPFEKVCAHEKWKKAAFDAYLDIQRMNCKGTRNKRTNKLSNAECSLAVRATAKPGGATVMAWVKVADSDKLANRMNWPPEKYKTEDIRIYDSAGNVVSVKQKLRLTGSRRDLAECQFSVDQIDLVK